VSDGPTQGIGHVRRLADGNEMPVLGLGVWQVPQGPECERAVRWALELGYRHIDTAQAYGNEVSVGKALKDSGVPRAEVFLTTKFQPSRRDPNEEIQRSLERLGVDQVDLYIIHWPAQGAVRPWPGMVESQANGYTRSIGVSNYSATQIEELLQNTDTPPVTNQVQFSAFEYRRELLHTCEDHGIVLTAYSSLGTGRHLGDDTVQGIAARLGRTPAQVLLRWCLQHGTIIIPKSTHRERIEENAQVFDFELSADDMSALDALDRTHGTAEARERKWW
jgi:diketogulonate reductase-like aldo/keto reductase